MIIKCKMCGGDIQFQQGDTVGQCDHCGSSCTIPKVDEEQKLNRYNRANHFRRQCDFDKAITAYERILEEDDNDAEAHWGIVLSRYGIEYVEDPATKHRVPTCHRVQVESILADADYQAALNNAPDTVSRNLYEEQAKEIAEIQKGILAISQNEKPYDVFICYKESDENGQRTRDSALAQEIYYGLTEQGYKVFFSRITLEDKLGQQYEPYVFAALNSAKVMIVVGTKPEYFSAVWVKNEWSRYLHLMASDRKRLLIPCYRDMDPYDLPEELSNLQSQDMSRIGFMQDLLRGVRKVLDAEKEEPSSRKAVVSRPADQSATEFGTPGVSSLMKRAYLFLEDRDFNSALEYLDRVLDIDPECSAAYAAKVCAKFGLEEESDLAELTFLFDDNTDWQKALRFASPQQKATYEGYYAAVKDRVQNQIRQYAFDCAVEMAVVPNAKREELENDLSVYKRACSQSSGDEPGGGRRLSGQQNEETFRRAIRENEPGEVSEQSLKIAAEMLEKIGDEAAMADAVSCRNLAELARKKTVYLQASGLYSNSKCEPTGLDKAAQAFASISDYKDAKELAQKCQSEAEEIRSGLYDDAVQAMKAAGEESQKWENAKKKLADSRLDGYGDISSLRNQAAQKYEQALAGEAEARRQAEELARCKAAAEARKKKRIKIISALAVVAAIAIFFVAIRVIIPGINYRKAVDLQQAGKYEEAIKVFKSLNDYSDSAEQYTETKYLQAAALQQEGKYEEAITAFEALNGFSDSAEQITETKYLQAKMLTANGDYTKAAAILINLKGYKDVDTLLENDGILAATREVKLAPYRVAGSVVTFGTYPQTKEGTDQTPVEWIVLDYDEANHKALLLSRYGLDAVPYNKEYTAVTWEQCTLRAWLNSDFLDKAFSAKEQSAIRVTNVDNSSGQGYSKWDTDGGNNTREWIFLLSYAEANRYLGVTYDDINNTKSCVAPTAYAIAQGAYTSDSAQTADGEPAGVWWLRSPGYYQDSAADVSDEGSLYFYDISDGIYVVRPAFWLNLESDFF